MLGMILPWIVKWFCEPEINYKPISAKEEVRRNSYPVEEE